MGAAFGAGIGGSVGALAGLVAGAAIRPYRESVDGIKDWKRRYPGYRGATDQEVLEAMSGATRSAMGACATIGAVLGGIAGAFIGEPKAPDALAQQQQQGG